MLRGYTLFLALVAATPAVAGPLGGLGVPQILHGVPGTVDGLTNRTTGLVDQSLTTVRDTVGRPSVPRAVEKDAQGFRIVRGEVLALAPGDRSLAIARGLAFSVIRQDDLPSLGLSVTVLAVPDGMSAADALVALRKADPAGTYDVDHIYDPSGGKGGSASAAQPAPVIRAAIRVGMIDGGVDTRHDAFDDAHIVTQGFVAKGAALATVHGTAVASLLVGRDDDVTGALPGATLFAADVYCGQPAGGSADAIAHALGWLAANDVAVANVSLTGPPNIILGAAVRAFLRRGHVLVAAVGNDGPAAGLEYPAAYPGVVGVTAVDDKHDVQLEANRGADVMFAAPGVDVTAATPRDRHDTMTGTSFAAPIVAARFAVLMPAPDPKAAAAALATLEKNALHLGAPGRNDTYGFGFLDRPGPLPNTTAAR